MRSVIMEIEARAASHPDKLLFAFLDIHANIKESVSYSAFQDRTKHIAAHILTETKLKQGDRVLLVYPPGIEMIAAFFACVRLGLVPVPAYPPSAHGLEASLRKMDYIAQDCSAKAIATDRSCYWSYKVNSSRNKNRLTDLQWIVTEDAPACDTSQLPEVHNDLLFIQYTSGSTSDPKGVMVSHENIIRNCEHVVDHMPVGVSWLPQYHDMGLIGYYLFFAIKGGTTYGFSPSDFMQRPALWLEAISKFKATASSAPNFAYEYCMQTGKIPETTLESLDLSSLQFLMNAAEPIKPKIYHSFLAQFKPYGLNPQSYFGAYGLAEFTLAVTNYGRTSLSVNTAPFLKQRIEVSAPSSANGKTTTLMSCGKALGDTVIKIVQAGDENIEVQENEIGEIWLQGSSKCLGYWNRPDLTAEFFDAQLSGYSGTWLRTGDLGFLNDGELYVCGRSKDLIIVRGLNYYPQDIEALIETDPLVRNGSVAAFTAENEELIVIVGIKNPTKIPDHKSLHLNVQQHLGLRISEFVFVAARTVPKTSSGKLRRQECKRQYLENELQVISCEKIGQEFELTANNVDLSAYTRLFNQFELSGNESEALGDAGLDSLKIAEFGHDLKDLLEERGFDDLSHEVDLKLLQQLAVSELFAILKDLYSSSQFARFKFRKAFSRIRSEYEASESALMVRDNQLPDIQYLCAPVLEFESDAILLTGGTGFFGPFLLKSLLEQTSADIFVIVRANSIQEGKARLQHAFQTINPSVEMQLDFAMRVNAVCGDLAKPKLGLNERDWNFLSNSVHTIYHNGAYVNYLMDYSAMRQINVESTKTIIELATTARRKVLNHISTTFIFGWSVKETLSESDSNAERESLDFGYSQSKWVADQLVLKAMDQGLEARIFRPALIAPSTNGDGSNFDISIRLLAFMLKYGIGTDAGNQVSFSPADTAANNVVAISNLEASAGKVFHVTRDEYSTMQDVTDILSRLAGKQFTNFNLKAFVPEVVSRCKKEDLLFPLLNFLVRSVDQISAMEFKRYDNRNYQTFRRLSDWGKEDQPLEEVVQGIYRFLLKNKEVAASLGLDPITIEPKHQSYDA